MVSGTASGYVGDESCKAALCNVKESEQDLCGVSAVVEGSIGRPLCAEAAGLRV